MKFLLIDANTIAECKRLREFAEANPVPFIQLWRQLPIGNNPNHVAILPECYRVVFSLEQQPAPLGSCRHMSMSTETPNCVPDPSAAAMVATLLGFTGSIPDWKCWLETLSNGQQAANILQPVNGWPKK